MTLDPAMRKWKITVKDDTKYRDVILPQSKAKLRHIKDGFFTNIQLSVQFEAKEKMPIEDIDKNMLIAEVILNNWKNNIVALDIFIYGHETFLLDQEFNFPKLQELTVYDGHFPNSEEDLDNNRKEIKSSLIQNHADTLESLDLEQNVQVTVPLKLETLSVNTDSVSSLLSNSSKTLKTLHLSGPTIHSQAMICCPELKLTELQFISSDGSLPPSGQDMVAIMKACQKTLKFLTFYNLGQQIQTELRDELKSVQLGLENIIYWGSNAENLPVLLKANSSTLKELKLGDIIVSETMQFDDDLQLSLEYFLAKSIPKKLASILINKSMKTLSELVLSSVNIKEHDLVMNKLQLKKLWLIRIHSNTAAKLISLSENLVELRLDNISCSKEIGNKVKLGKLKRLECNYTCINLAENLTNLANLSLTELVVKSPRPCDCVLYPKCDLGNLTKFDCEGGSPEYVSKILNSSHKTLKDVKISKLKNGKFSIENDLNLRIFLAVDIELAIVKSVLLNQASALNRLVLKFKEGEQTVDSTLLHVLVEFRANNPHCLVELKDEE